MSARPGEEYVIMRDAFMQPAFFLAGNRARNCGQKHVYFNYFIAQGFCDRSAQFLVKRFILPVSNVVLLPC